MVIKFFRHNKQARASILTIGLSLLSILSLLMATFQVNAWFKSHHTHSTPAIISNFEQTTQYYNGSSWVTLDSNGVIPLKSTDKIRVRIHHKGVSASYIRVSVTGNFYNADTNTLLPQSDTLFNIDLNDNSKWKKINTDSRHIYYSDDFYSWDHSTVIPNIKNASQDTEEFTVSVNQDAFPEEISPHQEYQGELYIHVDAVQPDRYQEFWNITSLPFTLS